MNKHEIFVKEGQKGQYGIQRQESVISEDIQCFQIVQPVFSSSISKTFGVLF